MNVSNPIVSIIIPTFNRAGFISETLQSVKNQTYLNWECIVVDDGSTDNTIKIATQFAISDKRFLLTYNNRKKGPQGARNTGIEISRGEYLIFLDSDDLLSNTCISNRIKIAVEMPDFELFCFPTGIFMNKPFDTNYCWNYLTTSKSDILRFLMQDMPWHTCGAFWKRSLINLLEGWDENLLCWQDWDIHLRMLFKKDINYYKCPSQRECIDNFYRKDWARTSISSTEKGKKQMLNKMYLMSKIKNNILEQRNSEVSLEYARLIYRITDQSIKELGVREAKSFFINSMKGLGFPSISIFLWFNHLRDKHFPFKNKIIKKIVWNVPLYFKRYSLEVHSCTHLTAVLS